ncbi:MAG: hypothetical protein EZS28_016595 [Streblomastix strix]|uniref:Uncharacterized protein n=1 Tax=Streblomastix strix TaxID=222440 RepID=A0A5J4W047_9EUKA|nr:MAG: hypothetical protein EZS28_016595 [Streblomastix strix]
MVCVPYQHPSVSIGLDRLAIQNVILVLKFRSKQGERQVVIAGRLKVTVTNVLPVQVVRLVIIAQFIGVSGPTVSPTMVLVIGAATKSIANIVITVITLALELFG